MRWIYTEREIAGRVGATFKQRHGLHGVLLGIVPPLLLLTTTIHLQGQEHNHTTTLQK